MSTTPINGYCTLADMLAFLPNSASANTASIEQSIEAASRAIEGKAGRYFYPVIKTNTYDVPYGILRRDLTLNDDLLEVITLTNGNNTVLASTEYNPYPFNSTPKASIVLKRSSAYSFEPDAITNETENVISVYGVYGYHNQYSLAWITGSTLNGAITSTTATTITMTAISDYVAGQLVRVDNEIMRVTATGTLTLTVDRGWNGSIAATHLTLTPVKIWRVQADIIRATMIQAARLYRRNEVIFGTTGGGDMGVQAVPIPGLDPDVKTILDPYIYRL